MKRLISKMLKKFFPAIYWKLYAGSQHNNEESKYLIWLCEEINVTKSFVEFGFGVFEFNSVSLVRRGFKGLLLDGGEENCRLANLIFKRLNLDVKALWHWIEIKSLDPIVDFVSSLSGKIGVLNIDIDGNDYWILKELLKKISPDVICVEHNASFGLESISTPYKSDFDRRTEDPSNWYHGASITAFYNLLQSNYLLVKNIAGVNLVFVKKDKMTDRLKALTYDEAWSEPQLRNKWSGTNAKQQWDKIKHLKFELID